MKVNVGTAIFITCLLRHEPQLAGLHMDEHGWVCVQEVIDGVNAAGHHLTAEMLEEIVRTDSKGRFRFDDAHERIRACQGHTVPWVVPYMTCPEPPARLYHGTTEDAWALIQASGGISRMQRHAVHMQPTQEKAWQSARRWHRRPVLLEIDAQAMHRDGMALGLTDNGVWCAESVPVRYVVQVIRP